MTKKQKVLRAMSKEVLRKALGYLTWRRKDSGTLPVILQYWKHSTVEVGPYIFGVATRNGITVRESKLQTH